MHLGQLCLSELCSFFLIHEIYSKLVKRFIRKYAAVPVQPEIVILQYTGWCVLIVWTFCLQSIQLLLPVSNG